MNQGFTLNLYFKLKIDLNIYFNITWIRNIFLQTKILLVITKIINKYISNTNRINKFYDFV